MHVPPIHVSLNEQWLPQLPQLPVSLMNEAWFVQLPMHIV